MDSAVNVSAGSLLVWNKSDLETNSEETIPQDVFMLPWNNPFNIISQATFLAFEKIMICYVSLLLFLVGVPGNILSSIVFYRHGLKDRMNLSLFCLAFFDLLFVAFFFLVGSHCILGNIRPDLEQWWKYFTRKYFTGVYRGFLYSSGCLTALISLERCICVVLPMKFTSLIKTRTMAIIIASIVGCIHLLAVLYPLHLEIGSRMDSVTGKTILYLTSSQLYRENRLLYTVLEDTILMVVVPLVNFVIVVVSTTVTVLELKIRMRWRQLSSSTTGPINRQQLSLIKMLVVVSVIYVVTAAPNVALGLTRSLVPEFHHTGRYSNIFLASHLLYLMLAMFNSSVNFFVYVARSSRFRSSLFGLFCRGGDNAYGDTSATASDGPQASSLPSTSGDARGKPGASPK